MQTNLDILRQEVLNDIALSLGGRVKAFLSAKEVEATGYRTLSSLENDKRLHQGPLKPISAGGMDKYRLSDLVNLAVSQKYYGCRRLSEKKLKAVTENLKLAQKKRAAKASTAHA